MRAHHTEQPANSFDDALNLQIDRLPPPSLSLLDNIAQAGERKMKGKTPAQASGIDIRNDWHALIKEATRNDVETELRREEESLVVIAK